MDSSNGPRNLYNTQGTMRHTGSLNWTL